MLKRTLKFHWIPLLWFAFIQVFIANTVFATSCVEFLEKSEERILTYSPDFGLTANVDLLQTNIVEIVIQIGDKTILVNVGYGDRDKYVYINGMNVDTGKIETFTANDSDVLKRFLLCLLEQEQFGHNILEKTFLRTLNLLYSWPQNTLLFLSMDKSTISSMMGGHSGEVRLRSELRSGSDNSTLNSTGPVNALSQSICNTINETQLGSYIFSPIDPIFCSIGRESIPISRVVGPYPFQPNGCFGRCGAGCLGDPGGPGGLLQNDLNIFTQNCFNHDACVDALGDLHPCCMEMFLLTIDDFYNGIDCTPVLIVTINPQGAVDAGAKWQVEGDPFNTGWHSSGEKIDWLPENTYRIIFSDIAGWNTPSPQTESIKSGTPVTTSGTYTVAPVVPTIYLLSVTKSGAGSGTVTSSPAGIDCGTTCAASFNSVTVVTLTATPQTGTFAGWTGCPSANGNTCTVPMTTNISVDALFTGSGSSWSQIAPSNPENMVAAGSLLYGDFGASGIWMWNGSAWSQITLSNPETMAAAGSLLYGDFGAGGIWMWNGSAWSQIVPSNPENMVAAGSLLYGDFGAGGIWMWNGSAWSQIVPSNPENMVAAGSLLYGDFGAGGIWMWNGSAWSQIVPSNPENMVAAGSFLYGDFGAGGIWMWNGSAWSQIAPSNPENMVAAGSLLYGDFGVAGIWVWNGSTWTHIAVSNPETMAAAGSLLYADFGASGIWTWNGIP